MKRILFSILTFILVLGFNSSTYAASITYTYPIFIDGQRLLVTNGAVIENGVAYVPFEEVSKKLGFKVTVNSKEKTFSASKNGVSVNGAIGSKYGKASGKKIELSSAPKLIGGKLYVPINLISNMVQGKYSYDSRAKIINIGEFQPHDQYFHMNWGMTKEQVKKLEKGQVKSEGENVAAEMYQVVYSRQLGDYKLDGDISYFFKGNKLAEVYVDYESTDFSSAYSAYVNSYNHLNETYGEYNDDMKWKISSAEQRAYWDFYDDDVKGMIYTALLIDDLRFSATYENQDTNITLFLGNTGTFNKPQFSTFIYYEPK